MDDMNLFADFETRIRNATETIDLIREKRAELDFGRIAVEPPRDASHGDVATNAAVVLGKPLGTNPRALAELFVERTRQDADDLEDSRGDEQMLERQQLMTPTTTAF